MFVQTFFSTSSVPYFFPLLFQHSNRPCCRELKIDITTNCTITKHMLKLHAVRACGCCCRCCCCIVLCSQFFHQTEYWKPFVLLNQFPVLCCVVLCCQRYVVCEWLQPKKITQKNTHVTFVLLHTDIHKLVDVLFFLQFFLMLLYELLLLLLCQINSWQFIQKAFEVCKLLVQCIGLQNKCQTAEIRRGRKKDGERKARQERKERRRK